MLVAVKSMIICRSVLLNHPINELYAGDFLSYSRKWGRFIMVHAIYCRIWKEKWGTPLTDLIPCETAGEQACRRGWQYLCTPSVCIHTKCCCVPHRFTCISNIYWTGAVQCCKSHVIKSYVTVVCHVIVEITVNRVHCPFNVARLFLFKVFAT